MKYVSLILLPTVLCLSGCFHPLQNARLEKSFALSARKTMDDKAFENALKRGANPDMQMKNGATPLIMAIVRNSPARAEKLINAGADVNHASKQGSTPLHVAAGFGRMNFVEMLLKAGARPDLPGNYGRTPLMEAARTGNIAVMERLLKAGARITVTDQNGRTSLIHAAQAQKNSLASVKFLIAKGADPMVTDKSSKLAVMYAAEMKNTDVALYLIDLIPDLPKKPGLGLLIMYSAIQGGDAKVVEKLINNRIPLNREPSLIFQGSRLLQIKGFYRNLLRSGLMDKNRTPLHWAAKQNNLEITNLLLARGAYPFQSDDLDITPDELTTSQEVQRAIQKKQKEILIKQDK